MVEAIIVAVVGALVAAVLMYFSPGQRAKRARRAALDIRLAKIRKKLWDKSSLNERP